MTDSTPPQVLSGALCPWLLPKLEQLERAHANDRLGHAWLIAGRCGIGKLNLALVLAQRLLTGRRNATPATLEAREAGDAMRARHEPADRHPDLHWLHPEEDKTAIGIEQVRAAAAVLSLKGFGGGAKVVIVEPAEAMTVAAANALLKTLEEPTAETYLLLISHQPGRLPQTIRSRCQTLSVRGPTAEAGRRWLEPLAGKHIDGLPFELLRAPLELAQDIEAYMDNNINEIYAILDKIYQGNADANTIAEQWAKLDLALILEALTGRLRQVIKARATREHSNSITDRSEDPLHNAWSALTLTQLFRQLDAAMRLRESLGTGINAELALRVLLLGFQPHRGAL